MTEPEVTLPELRAVDLFDDLSDEELSQWLPVTTARRLEAGDVIAELGQQPRGLQLLLEGEADSLMEEHGREEPVGRQHAPTWMGAIAVLTEAPLGVRMRAATPVRVALVPAETFRWVPFVVLLAVAGALSAVGQATFSRRDLR